MKNKLLFFGIELSLAASIFGMARNILRTEDLATGKTWRYLIASAIFFMLFLLPIFGSLLKRKTIKTDTTFSKNMNRLVQKNSWLSFIIFVLLGYVGYTSAQSLMNNSDPFPPKQIAAFLSVMIIWGLGFLLLFAETAAQFNPRNTVTE